MSENILKMFKILIVLKKYIFMENNNILYDSFYTLLFAFSPARRRLHDKPFYKTGKNAYAKK